MGLLDNLAASLISSSTGLDRRMVRRFVRKAGGGKLLMLGGAVIAGAVGSELAEQKPQGASSPPASPPPPPPGAGAAPPPPPTTRPDLPPLPPLPEEKAEVEAAEATLPSDTLYAVIRTMVAAALADGTLSSEEKRAVDEQLETTSELSADERRQIHRDLVLPPSPEDLAELPGAREEPEMLYRFAILVLEADGEASETERTWLARLGDALDLDADRRKALETQVVG